MQRIPICFALICLIAFVGCKSEKTETTVTYHDDIEPLMASHCTRCHYDGGLGSGDFTDADEVESLADWMQTAMDDERMPPPASDPECRDYTGSDHLRMSDESKDLFAAWVDAGMERGESDESAVSETVNTELAQPDVTILMPDVYTPTYERTDEPDNEYRCFILDTSDLEGKYITAIGAQVGAPEIMHHITLSLVDKDDVTEEYQDPQGWDCIDNVVTFNSEFMFAGFAPGTMPFEFPEGAGFEMSEDQTLVLSMHYVHNPDAEGVSDQTGFDFGVADEVDKELYMLTIAVDDFEIPAETTGHTDKALFPAYYVGDFDIVSVLPHLHQLGVGYEMSIEHSDGSESCVVRGDYSFDNQLLYQFVEPLSVDSTDIIHWECTWDNPGAEAVYYGERTDEEMCIFFTIVSASSARDDGG